MDVWIEIFISLPKYHAPGRHILYGCVDWNDHFSLSIEKKRGSHPIWMCGLKFQILYSTFMLPSVTSYMDVWIEINAYLLTDNNGVCHILYGCVDWNLPTSTNSE